MATSDDFTFGHNRDRDEVLEGIFAELGISAAGRDAPDELLALVLLDKHYGVWQPGDYVYVNPLLSWGIMAFTVVDPDIDRAFHDQEDGLTDAEVAAADERTTREPFEIRVEYCPAMFDGGVPDPPEKLLGQTILVRIMTESDVTTGKLPNMMTVRADGTPITLPGDRSPDRVG